MMMMMRNRERTGAYVKHIMFPTIDNTDTPTSNVILGGFVGGRKYQSPHQQVGEHDTGFGSDLDFRRFQSFKGCADCNRT